ncbi:MULTISPECIES: cell division protein CrgA [unclassified Janibacter]|uniref:cell division protein CrgA n=1 Tax=unclassified Janibacter TaxID=2649294 RepID=UPI003CFE5281
MPESKGRKKPQPTTPEQTTRPKAVKVGNPSWFVPVMLGLMIIGLLWVVVFYVTSQQYPVPSLGRWNLGVGFAFMLTGFMMTTRWR